MSNEKECGRSKLSIVLEGLEGLALIIVCTLFWRILRYLLQNLGAIKVKIIENKSKDTIQIIKDLHVASSTSLTDLRSEYSGLFCMGCRKFFTPFQNLVCETCNFNFCKDCLTTWKSTSSEGICLGSTFTGRKHNFISKS